MKLDNRLNMISEDYNKLLEEKEHFVEMASKQQKILDLCPQGMPDGTGIFTAESWIKWARKKLGYEMDKR